jgi:hypothetical protein
MALTKATFSMIDGAYANIKDYGVTGDGITNDTVAIQNVLNDFAGVNTVFFPPGTYMVEGDALVPGNTVKEGIHVPSNSSIVFADGAVLQLITTTSVQYNILVVYNVSDVHIVGGKLIGDTDNHPPGTLGSTFNGIGLRIQGATNVLVENLSVEKCYADGIAIVYDDQTALQPECQNIVINSCSSTYNYRNGLSVIGCIGGSTTDCNYSYNGQATETQIGEGIDIEPNAVSGGVTHYVKNYSVTDCTFNENRTTGIGLYGAGTPPNDGIIDGITIANNKFYTNGANISMFNGINVSVTGNNLMGSTIGVGITADHCRKVNIANNIVYDSQLTGILINNSQYTTHYSSDINIIGNIVEQSGTNGIVVSGSFNNFSNIVIDGNQSFLNQEYGITGNNITNGVVANNVSNNNNQSGGSYTNLDFYTCTDVIVANNATDTSYSVSGTWVKVYRLVDSASTAIRLTVTGSDGTNVFQDVVAFDYSSTPVVVSATTIKGTPSVRNYNSTAYPGYLSMYMNSGTYTITTIGVEQ